jgi:hypothetical protein
LYWFSWSALSGVPGSALPESVSVQSGESIGQFEGEYHSASRLRPLPFWIALTNNRSDADVICASSGSELVSNRRRPTVTGL